LRLRSNPTYNMGQASSVWFHDEQSLLAEEALLHRIRQTGLA